MNKHDREKLNDARIAELERKHNKLMAQKRRWMALSSVIVDIGGGK